MVYEQTPFFLEASPPRLRPLAGRNEEEIAGDCVAISNHRSATANIYQPNKCQSLELTTAIVDH
jgi:hypothetical protein